MHKKFPISPIFSIVAHMNLSYFVDGPLPKTSFIPGYIGGSYHTHEGGGSNYLCLPENPKYGRIDRADNNQGKIDGVEFELNEESLLGI